MKRMVGYSLVILSCITLAHALAAPLEAQGLGRGSSSRARVCFYMDSDYRGDQFCASPGESKRNVGAHYNDKISSIRFYGGAEVTVYEDEDFRGNSQTITSDVPNLRDWNDKITSFEVRRGSYGGGGHGGEPRNGACFYTDENYNGEMFCMNSGESQRNVGDRYNDKISSIRVFGGAEVTVYEDENLRGNSQTITRDMPNLRNWNDKITSLEIRRGAYGSANYGGEPRNGACFYTNENYSGEMFCMNSGESQRNVGDRYNDKISSIRVFGGADVVVYEDENFRGNSQSFRHDVSNLGGWNDKITSIEIR